MIRKPKKEKQGSCTYGSMVEKKTKYIMEGFRFNAIKKLFKKNHVINGFKQSKQNLSLNPLECIRQRKQISSHRMRKIVYLG